MNILKLKTPFDVVIKYIIIIMNAYRCKSIIDMYKQLTKI